MGRVGVHSRLIYAKMLWAKFCGGLWPLRGEWGDGMAKKLQRWGKQVRAFVTRHFLSTFRATVLSFYIPVIIAFILVTGTLSYVLAMRQVEESARHEIEGLVHQTCIYADNRFQAVLEQMTALADDPVILDALGKQQADIGPQTYLSAQAHVDTIRLYNSSIIDTVYINLNHGAFTFFRGDDDYRSVVQGYQDYADWPGREGADITWRAVMTEHNAESRVHSIDVVRHIGNADSERRGLLVFRLRREFFTSLLAQRILGGQGCLMLVSPDVRSVFGTVPQEYQLDKNTLTRLRQVQTPSGFLEYTNEAGEQLVLVYDTLSTNEWKLAATFRHDALLGKIVYIKYMTVALILILMVLAVILTNTLAGYIMRPLSQLIKRMEAMRQQRITPATPGAPHTLTRPGHVNEVEVLGHGVDDLMGHVNELMAQVKKDQELQRELELSVVQMQVHPHFLYNTLFAIKGLCDMGLNEDASKMILALANFFRIGLSHGREIIPVAQEVDHARNYLYIQEMRYGDVFTYSFDIADDIGDYSIIKLTLQPLVENAIYHGVKEKRGQGLIQVRGWAEDGMLHFTVEDDGMGMTPERLAELRRGLAETRLGRKHVGFGVFSVFERLRLHYGEEAGLEITSELGKGTCIHVVLPARRLEESNDA